MFSRRATAARWLYAVRTVLNWTPEQRRQGCQANKDFVRGEFDVQLGPPRVSGLPRHTSGDELAELGWQLYCHPGRQYNCRPNNRHT